MVFVGFRNRAMRTILASAALGTILVGSVAAAAPGASKQRTLATRGPVLALAADGDRAALVVGFRYCASVAVWQPSRRRVVRLQRPCRYIGSLREGTQSVALAGTRAAWLRTAGGNTLETIVMTATLARPKPVWLAYGAAFGEGGYGTFAREPAGDGALLAFTVDRRCEEGDESYPCPPGRKTGDIVAATVWSVGGQGRCPFQRPPSSGCSRVAEAEGELSVLAVDAGRIAVRTESSVRLLTAGAAVLQEFDLTARAAALSGNRLAVRTAVAVEVYDIDSGQLAARFPAARHLRLEDLERDILVTASGRAVTLRRLTDGRARTIHAGGIAHAQLEPPGLFVAAGRRVTFTPMRDVLRRFDD
jgi:hypothetical protein